LVAVFGTMGVTLILKDSTTLAQETNNNINSMMSIIEQGASSDIKTQTSGNPYDYTKNNIYFNKIVDMGYPVLPYLEDYITKSPDNGLREYLLAIACEEISQVNLKVDEEGNKYKWETGKGFVQEWDKHLQNIGGNFNTILNSSSSDEYKTAALVRLGLPVVPLIIDQFEQSSPNQQQILALVLKDLLNNNKQAQFNSVNVTDAQTWIKNNKTKFNDFKLYIESKASQ
jgi:hypothetical protein